MEATVDTAQHTPGPWHIDPELDYVIRAPGEFAYLASGQKIAQLRAFQLNVEADARLIAAAPALLAALGRIADWLDVLATVTHAGSDGELAAETRRVRNAIAAAKGGA